jgi:hypothetical protein
MPNPYIFPPSRTGQAAGDGKTFGSVFEITP